MHRILGLLFCSLLMALPSSSVSAEVMVALEKGDHVCYIGNTLADRMQHHAWLETYIHATHPELDLTFRNLGFAGDEVKTRPRSQDFGSADAWLTKEKADVVFCFFGYNEAFRSEAGLAGFKTDLAAMIDGMLAQKYNGESAPKLVVFSPIAHEDLSSPNLPDGKENNKNLMMYLLAMQQVCADKGVPFVDIFHATKDAYEKHDKPLTMNGVHLLDVGNKVLAEIILKDVFEKEAPAEADVAKLRDAVLEKNYYWFSRYRVVDGYNVFGGRSRLAWDGMSNADVMKREMEIFDVMTANRDKRVWAVAKGGDLEVKDDNIPEELVVKANAQSKRQRALGDYLGGKEAISKMTIAKGMEVNLFASEEMFPELVNPVQMAVDTDGRLFASVWPSYPHWNPTQPRTDRLVCLPDEDGDGVADECIVFADKLNSITGFEFWGGGVLVAAPPEIWFLKDTDGDNKADFKLRMLQGVSSADSHHTANAMVIGPDGWLYWSRGIFNIANMETPTKTFRQGASGVYRFNPRTFEVEFHFPIGPNPHGDVFDQWGYQFANDGTGGTGSYVNIGKGRGNKKWFKKRVRPVAATGILSSEHFPEENNGNFLICNTIGFLGVLQHKVRYEGADIIAEEIEPIIVSTDPNFRPTDVEVGGDGALYVSDWSNAIIGHMQHNMRDPNRDAQHGRIYRVTAKGRPITKLPKLKGKPIEEVCQAFFSGQNSHRYRARLELTGRDPEEIKEKVTTWARQLSPKVAGEAQALLECLWVFEEQRIVNLDLLTQVFLAEDARVRAAAIRTLGHWAGRVDDWESILTTAGADDSPLVRAEAAKAAAEFKGLEAAETIFKIANMATDPELDNVLNYAKSAIDVDSVIKEAVASGKELSVDAQQYVLRNASVEDLMKLDRTEAVYRAILSRDNATADQMATAIDGLAKIVDSEPKRLIEKLIMEKDERGLDESVSALGSLWLRDSVGGETAKRFVEDGKTAALRQLGYADWIKSDGDASAAFDHASKDKKSLSELLAAIPKLSTTDFHQDATRSLLLYNKLGPLMSKLPGNLDAEDVGPEMGEVGIHVDWYDTNPGNAEAATFAKLKPKNSGMVDGIKLNVPQKGNRDSFGLRFTGSITIEKPGRYRFFTTSDDGSRLYIGDKQVVNNDGQHGMTEKSGRIRLEAGSHPIMVTYYDNGGNEGLAVKWQGPGFKKQPIPTDVLSVVGADTLHDVAIRSVATIPSVEHKLFADLGKLIEQGKSRRTAIETLLSIPRENWPKTVAPKDVLPVAESLASYVAEIPEKYLTGKQALQAMELTDKLSSLLPEDQARKFQARVADLRINIVRIGTVVERMIYDKEIIAIQAGKPVEFIFTNPDNMQHNFVIVQPGSLEEVGELAEATSREKDAIARQYVPKSDKILLASRQLEKGEAQVLRFQAPKEPGIYPYVCTYPGHWRRMYGALYVVGDLTAYSDNPVEYLAANPLPIKDELLKYSSRNREWTYDELASALPELHGGRSFEVGKTIFKAASCVACHKLNGEGYEFGPDLAKLDTKKSDPKHILMSLIDPAKEIEEKYRSYSILLESGKQVNGMLLKETDTTYELIVDPLAKPDPIVVKKSDIDEMDKLPSSPMPKGLLNKLLQEEILDLIAYVHAGGNKDHMLYKEGHKHDH